MLNPVEELKKYRKININGNSSDYFLKLIPMQDISEQNEQLIDEIGRLSRNQFKSLQKIDTSFEEIMEFLQKKIDKLENIERTLIDKDEKINALKLMNEQVINEKSGIIITIIKILDVYDLILASVSKSVDETWLKQFERAILLVKSLTKEIEIEEINPNANTAQVQDQESNLSVFDPYLHEVVGVASDKSKGHREVIDIISKGYKWKGKIVRKAKVIVNNLSEGEVAGE